VKSISTGFYFEAKSQANCTPPAPVGEAGLSPEWTSLQCAEVGVAYTQIVNIENLSTVTTPIGVITVTELVVDSVVGLPSGFTYEFNPGTILTSGQTACMEVTGTTNDPIGCYLLDIYITITIDLGPLGTQTFSGEAVDIDFTYYVQVINTGMVCDCQVCDDTATCLTGITYLEEIIEEFQIHPNPFTQITEITFYSSESGIYTTEVYDIIGKEVYSAEVDVVQGINVFPFKRGELTKGVYIYTITDGESSVSQRFMIKD